MAEVAAPAEPRPEPEKKPSQAAEQFKENKQDFEKQPEPEKVHSQQVANQQHGLQKGPKSPLSTGQAVDNQAHKDQMQNDSQRAAAGDKSAEIQKMATMAKSDREKFNHAAGKEQDQQQDKGMGR